MTHRKHIVDLELKIENMRAAIAGLLTGNSSRAEIDRALSELARVKAERLRLMLRQVNLRTELHQATGTNEALLSADGGKP